MRRILTSVLLLLLLIPSIASAKPKKKAKKKAAPVSLINLNPLLHMMKSLNIWLLVLFVSVTSVRPQVPARAIPTEVEKTEVRVSQIITRAEDHFRKGKLNLDDNKREAARDEFDKAVDTILESGLNVRERGSS